MVKRDRNIESENLKKKRRDLRKRSTLSERHLWQWLRRNKFDCKFRRQAGIGKYIVDFYCHEFRLVIELDGPIHDDELIKKYDIERENWLWTSGYVVVRFLNDEVLFEGDKVLQCIEDLASILDN